MKGKDPGIIIIARFYIVLIFLYSLPLFIFATQLNILGKIFSSTAVSIVNICFIALLWFLYRKVKKTEKIGFWGAIIFHSFFIVNSLLMIMDYAPLLMVEGVKTVTPIGVKPVLFGSIIVNLVIISYLVYRKKLFSYGKNTVDN